MSYTIPTPPNTGMALDADENVWTRDANNNWSSKCRTCRTALGQMTWAQLLVEKVTLEDVPVPPEVAAAGEPA